MNSSMNSMERKRPRNGHSSQRNKSDEHQVVIPESSTIVGAAASTVNLKYANKNGTMLPYNYEPDPAFVRCTLWDNNSKLVQTALVDTGAQFSSISRKYAKYTYTGKTKHIILHNGITDAIDRQTTRVVQLGSLVVEHTFYVSNTLAAPVILGLDFLEKHDIDYASRRRFIKLRSKNKERVPLLTRGKSRFLAAALMHPKRFKPRKEAPTIVDRDYPEPTPGNATLTDEQKAQLKRLTDELKYCFASRERPLGNVTAVYHRVHPRGAPFKARLAALSPAQLKIQNECLDEMVKLGVARPSNSEWASRPSFAPKKDGTIRFCLNYRRLNQFDKKDSYPLPRAPQLLEGLSKMRYFTSLDAANGYWQIPVHPDDVKYTAVITQAGLFEFVRMPFGLSNGPATYQRLMDQVLVDGIRAGFTCVYLDDVLVYSETFEQHMVHVRQVMLWMYNAGLLLKAKKCSFFNAECEYLGHIVGNGQLRMVEDKIRKIIDFPKPKDCTEIMSFLGVTGYYRKFIRGYASIAHPLNFASTKNATFVWSPACNTAFETLKEMFNRDVPLQMPDYAKPFTIDTDASDFAVGAVLSQLDENNNERPVFFASRKLSAAEKKWPVRDKEALAILFGCQSFRHHILGTHFTVRSDHHSLQWLMDATTGRIARWATILAEYEPFDIKYRRGESNKVADALSRVYAWSECMPDVAFACGALHKDNLEEDDHVESDEAPPNPATYIDIPTFKMLEAAQKSDDFCIKQRVRQCENKSDQRSDRGYIIRDGLVGIDRYGRFLPLLPECFRTKFLQEVHAHPMSAHMGAKRLAARAGQIFAIPHIRQHARDVCAGCDHCLRRKKPQPKVGQLASRPPTKAWELISMDFCGPYPKSVHGNQYVLVIIDQFTKYVHLTPCKHANARTAYRALYEKIICNYGTPDKLLTDNGSHFRNKYMAAICAMFGIYHTFSSPYYPQGDGQVERFMRNMNDSLAALTSGRVDTWCDYVAGVQSAYNATPHAATFAAPYEMLYGHPPPPLVRLRHVLPQVHVTKDATEEIALLKAPMEEIRKRVRTQIERSWLQRAIAYNKGRTKVNVVVGNRCLIRLNPSQLASQTAGKLKFRWSEPVLVTAVKQSGKAFDVKTGDGRIFVVNATRMLPLPPSHWHAKSPTHITAWDQNSYDPEYPGVEFCVVSPDSGNRSISGVAAATQTVPYYPDSTDDFSAHDSSSGGIEHGSSDMITIINELQSTSVPYVPTMANERRSENPASIDDDNVSSVRDDTTQREDPTANTVWNTNIGRQQSNVDSENDSLPPSLEMLFGQEVDVEDVVTHNSPRVTRNRFPGYVDANLSSFEFDHRDESSSRPSIDSNDAAMVGFGSESGLNTTATSELSCKISLTSDHSERSHTQPIVNEQ
jgi:transposase InsO family protein